jgi:hypothetical protein
MESTASFTAPSSIEDAKAQLAEIKVKKQELSLQKKNIVEQQRQLRAEYTDNVRDRSTAGKGVGALVSKDIGKASKKVASIANSYDRKALANDLEPLEAQRVEVEAQIADLDRQKLLLDQWIAEQKAAGKTKSKPDSEPKAKEESVAPAVVPAAARSDSDARIAKLKELAELKEAGILTDEEFQTEKKRVLAEG